VHYQIFRITLQEGDGKYGQKKSDECQMRVSFILQGL